MNPSTIDTSIIDLISTGKRTTPWAHIGRDVSGAMTAEEAIRQGQLDWPVEKRQAYYPEVFEKEVVDPLTGVTVRELREELIEARDEYFIVRADRNFNNKLGRCKGRWQVFQNREAFDFFNSIVTEGEAVFHTAFEINNGQRIGILAKLPDDFEVVAGDIVNQYLLLTAGHDGQSSIEVKFTPIRVASMTTLTTALRGGSYKVKHSSKAAVNLKQAKELMGITNRFYTELKEYCHQMARYQLSEVEIRWYFESILGESVKKNEKVVELLYSGVNYTQESEGTLWQAYTALTEFIDHYIGYDNVDTRVNNVLFTGGARLKRRAFSEALKMLKSK